MDWQKAYQRRATWPGEGHDDWSGYDGSIYIGLKMRDLTTYTKRGWFMWSGGALGKDGLKKCTSSSPSWTGARALAGRESRRGLV